MWRALLGAATRDIVLNMVAASPLVPRTVRWLIYRAWGVRAATRAIMPRCFVGGSHLMLGRRTFVNYGCFFDTSSPIVIGSDCAFGMQVLLCTSTHGLGGPRRRGGRLESKPITIDDGCWIGARTVVLPGVHIGPGCVVAAGSVVTRDCAPHGLYAGNPARRVKDLPLSRSPNASDSSGSSGSMAG
jgi:acetyltransferase-like isoleucine patch superfamily enzyme